MRIIKSLILFSLLLLPLKAEAQFTCTYGTLCSSLNTSSTGAVTGTPFAVPSSYSAIITWTVVADGSALSAILEGSLDNVTYFTVDTQTTATGGIKNFGFTGLKFVRISAVSRTGGTATVGTLVTSRGFITGSSAGSLGSLNLSPGPLTITQGTLTSDTQAISTTATWNNAGTTFTHWKAVITDTASGAGSLAVSILGGAAGNTTLFSVNKSGLLVTGSSVQSGLDLMAAAARLIYWNGRSLMQSPSDGVIELSNNAGTDFSRLQFGGTTSSFPAIKRTGTGISFRLADDSANAAIDAVAGITSTAQVDLSNNALIRVSRINIGSGSVLAISATPPTVTSAGTSPSIPSNNGTISFTVNVGTGGTATTIVLGLPAATTAWNCWGENLTANAANRANQRVVPQSSTTTSFTLQNQTISTGAALAFTASDIVQVSCFAR